MSVVLITGAAKRLGRAIALKLAGAGYDIAIHYRASKPDAESLAAEVAALGRRAALIEGDLAKEKDVETFVARAGAALARAPGMAPSTSASENTSATATRGATFPRFDMSLSVPLRPGASLTPGPSRSLHRAPDERCLITHSARCERARAER